MANSILLYEDNPELRASIESMLRLNQNVTVAGAHESPMNVKAHIAQLRPDMLIMDIDMPGMSGIELQRHLLARSSNVPIIFITAHGSDERARSEAASDWTVAYFIKPFSADELLDAVNVALKWTSAAKTNPQNNRRSHE